MENKATLTYSFSESGDENLFLTLSTRLCDTLSNQTVEWRQTYGRASHQFQLKVKILPLATALLERTDLVTRPYFHIFWTDCNDLDQYRSTIRTEISSWVNTLKNYKDTEWMIVVVAGDILSRLTKAKLPIPRMSIPDKVKSDFCSKNPERLHILHDPTKETTKSTESWTALGLKVANQTVRCMEVVVSKYEERVRAERERRNEKSWDFCSYLILQEELAFMYEMLGMFSPALVQYDELDAMFTQYVLNANAGDIAHWLSRFSEPIKHWHSMLLWKRIDGDARRSILEGQASIIDIRNYLFTRLCHLLFETGKLTEITQRMHIFLHSLSTEIAILEITVPSGAIDCWVFMCCLELVGALCRKSQLQNETDNTATDNPCFDMSNEQLVLENASLWNIARLKLYSLGELCGLMPGIVTTSAHLQIVVDLLAGMGEGEERGDVATSPALVLREALSSKNNFQKQYFELSELAMGTFKHMGHFRAVRCIGNDMAEFYLKLGEPAQAENYLIDTVRMYEADGWPLLLAKANKMLARCYKKMINIRKYLRLCYSLMCDEMISQEERIFYCDEFKSLSTDLGDDTLALNIHPLASVTSIQFIPAETSLRLNSNHQIVVTINSNAPKPMTFQSLQISLDHLGPDDGIEPHNIPDVISLSSFFSRTSEDEADVKSLLSRNFSHNSSAYNSLQPFRRHKRYASTTSSREFMSNQPAEINDEGRIDLIQFPHSKPSKFPASISLHAQRDLQDGALAWAGITCRHANDLLRRQDSSQSQVDKHRSTMSVTMETYECCLTTRQVTLNPGMNRVKLNAKTDLEGYFTLQQLRMSLHKTSFVLPRIYPLVSYQVSYLQPKVFMDHNEDLISGIVQHINIAVNKGDYVNPEQESNSTLSFKTPPSVRLLCVTKCSVATLDEDVSEIENPSLVTSSDETSINLPSTSLHATVLLKIACLCLTTPYVQKLDVRKRHRRTHSAPPATFSRSPKSAPRHKPIVESPPNPSPPSDGDVTDSIVVHSDVANGSDVTNGGDVAITTSEPTLDVKQSRLSDLKDSIKKSRNNFKNKFSRAKPAKPRFDDWPTVPPNDPDVIITPSLRINGDLIEVTLDDNDVTQPVTPSPSKITETVSMTSYSEVTSSSSDDEDCKPVLIRKHSSTLPRHTPSKSDVGLTTPPVTSATSNSSSQITYDVTITTPWGDASTVTSQITCKRPVEFTHSWSFAGTDVVTRILTVVVENVTSSAVTLSEPKLSLSNIKDITSLNGKKLRPLRALGSSTFAWKVSSSPFNSLNTSGQFHADLVSRCDDISDDVTSTVTYQFEVDNLRPIYTIACSVDDDDELRNGVMTSLRVDVTRLRDDPDHETTSNGQQLLMFQVMDTRGRWAVFGKSSGILSMPATRIRESTHDATHVATATVEVMPLVSGSLHMPYVLLHRFMKRRSSEFDEQLSSTQSPVLKPPRLRDFERGEVFYHHVAHQVAVLPPQSDVTHCVTEL